MMLHGDFPWWVTVLPVLGYGVGAIVGLIAAGLAVAGGTAAAVRSAVEGSWPWEDPEAYFLDQLKGGVGGLGTVISAAQGEPSLQEQVKQAGEGTSREGGLAGVMQGATGQGLIRAQAEKAGQTPEQQAAGVMRPISTSPLAGANGPAGGGNFEGNTGTGGPGRFDVVDQAQETPSRRDILNQNWKSTGISAGIQLGTAALTYGAGSALGAAAAPAVSSIAPVIPEVATGAAPPLLGAIGAAAGDIAAPAATTAGTLLPAVAGSAPPLLSAAGPAAPSFLSTALNSLQVVPRTIGNTASGVLQQGITGAAKSGLSALLQDDKNPGRAALLGGIGGAVSGGASGLTSAMLPDPVSFGSGASQGVYTGMGSASPDFHYDASVQAPSWTGTLTKPVPGMLGGLAKSIVNQATLPAVPKPFEPTYQHTSPYFDMLDQPGSSMYPGGRRPYWMGI